VDGIICALSGGRMVENLITFICITKRARSKLDYKVCVMT
jgi:hypothetical protein